MKHLWASTSQGFHLLIINGKGAASVQKEATHWSANIASTNAYDFVYFNTLHDAKVWCETVTKMERS